jgi:hypothetical protein
MGISEFGDLLRETLDMGFGGYVFFENSLFHITEIIIIKLFLNE